MIVVVPRIFYVYAEEWNAAEKLKFGKVVKKRIPRGGRREVEVIEVSRGKGEGIEGKRGGNEGEMGGK